MGRLPSLAVGETNLLIKEALVCAFVVRNYLSMVLRSAILIRGMRLVLGLLNNGRGNEKHGNYGSTLSLEVYSTMAVLDMVFFIIGP